MSEVNQRPTRPDLYSQINSDDTSGMWQTLDVALSDADFSKAQTLILPAQNRLLRQTNAKWSLLRCHRNILANSWHLYRHSTCATCQILCQIIPSSISTNHNGCPRSPKLRQLTLVMHIHRFPTNNLQVKLQANMLSSILSTSILSRDHTPVIVLQTVQQICKAGINTILRSSRESTAARCLSNHNTQIIKASSLALMARWAAHLISRGRALLTRCLACR